MLDTKGTQWWRTPLAVLHVDFLQTTAKLTSVCKFVRKLHYRIPCRLQHTANT